MKKYKIQGIGDLYKMKLLSLGHKMKYKKENPPAFFQNFYKTKDTLNLSNKMDSIIPFYRVEQRKQN